MIMLSACRKRDFTKPRDSKSAVAESYTPPLQINIQDVYAALPSTVMYNLGDSAVFYLGQSTYSYDQGRLVVHIPTSQDGLHYLYAAKYAANPSKTLVYAVRFFPDSALNPDHFSGKMEWYNFQNGTAYGLKYVNNVVTDYVPPIFLVDTGWETCMLNKNDFEIAESGQIVVGNGSETNSENNAHQTAMRGGPYSCPHFNKGNGFFSSLGNFFSGIGHWIGGIFQGGGGGSNNGGGGFGWDEGGAWDWLPTTPGGGSMPPGYPPLPGGGGGGGGEGTPPPNNSGGNYSVVYNPALSGINAGSIYSIGDHSHSPTPGQAVLGNNLVEIDSGFSIHSVGGAKDSNGFYYSRITAMKTYLQAHPYGMIDCGDLSNLPMNMYQSVGSYQVPQIVKNRIHNIAMLNNPPYDDNNFKVQDINDGIGVVSCDYYPIHISQLPKNQNNQTMTPEELLEYFRLSINSFINNPYSPTLPFVSSVHFYPYTDNSNGANINETFKFNLSETDSKGAIIHINIPGNDGSVVESDYQNNAPSSGGSWFTFSTMSSVLDGSHPVCGNRRFGIAADPNGGYIFYFMGVDRIANSMIEQFFNNFYYNNALYNVQDALWSNMQDDIINFTNNHHGNALEYSQPNWIIRVNWSGPVKDFLQGHITLQ